MTTTSPMLPSAAAHVEETIHLLFSFIQAQGHTDYIGERISQLQHSLQCAHLASQSDLYGHDHEVILGALLHDVGRFIPAAKDMPKMIAPDGTYVGRSSHEVLGERYLRQLGFSEKVCQLVGAHVIAKRYLTAVEPGYYEALSTTSKRTLQYQGGSFTEKQIEEAQKDALLGAKLAVRKWDDLAKDPDMEVPGLETYKNMAINCLAAARSNVIVDHANYKLPTAPTAIIGVPRLFDTSSRSEIPISLSAMSSFAKLGGLVLPQLDEGVECDTKPNKAPQIADVFNAMSKFGLRTSILRIPKLTENGEFVKRELDRTLAPLLTGDQDISLVDLTNLEAKTDFWQFMPLLDAKIQQLIQQDISVIIAEDWDESNGTAESVLVCKPTAPQRIQEKTTSSSRLDVLEIAFN